MSDQFDNDDRDDEGEGESVEEHKSVIMHLLSQVRLGMDLTKVRSHDLLNQGFWRMSPGSDKARTAFSMAPGSRPE